MLRGPGVVVGRRAAQRTGPPPAGPCRGDTLIDGDGRAAALQQATRRRGTQRRVRPGSAHPVPPPIPKRGQQGTHDRRRRHADGPDARGDRTDEHDQQRRCNRPAGHQEPRDHQLADLGKEMWAYLTGKGAAINYEFVDMVVEVPRETGPEAPRALWRLNGTLRITTAENAIRG